MPVLMTYATPSECSDCSCLAELEGPRVDLSQKVFCEVSGGEPVGPAASAALDGSNGDPVTVTVGVLYDVFHALNLILSRRNFAPPGRTFSERVGPGVVLARGDLSVLAQGVREVIPRLPAPHHVALGGVVDLAEELEGFGLGHGPSISFHYEQFTRSVVIFSGGAGPPFGDQRRTRDCWEPWRLQPQR